MKLKKLSEIEIRPYPSDKAKNATGRVAIGKADGAENYCMRLMEVHEDGNTAMHSHDFEHEVFVHCGKGKVFGNGEWSDIQPGDVVFIPANETHQFKCVGEEPLLFVCVIPSGPPEL